LLLLATNPGDASDFDTVVRLGKLTAIDSIRTNYKDLKIIEKWSRSTMINLLFKYN